MRREVRSGRATLALGSVEAMRALWPVALERDCANTALANNHNAAAVHHAVSFWLNVDLVRSFG
jgi:hypothetical protein